VGELQRLAAGKPGASVMITSGITSASSAVAAISAAVIVPSTRPANAAAATATAALTHAQHAGTSAALSPPSLCQQLRTTFTN
jgi:hypothetical protein